MTKPYLTTLTKFISIDATTSLTGQKVVTCAFGAEEGEVKEFTISVEDACDLLASVVSALSSHGDETAIAIGETFLRRVSETILAEDSAAQRSASQQLSISRKN